MPRRARPVWVIRAAAGPSGRRPRTKAEPAGDGQLPWESSLAEPVTGRQPQAWAGQVVRADRTAPDAPPRRPLTRPDQRDLITFTRRGIISAVRGGRRGHGDDLLPVTSLAPGRDGRRMPAPWNSASTSARRYRGRPTSSRTSGSRPRRAQVATAAEVTRNTAATCLRVISSSSMWLPVMAASANSRAAGRGTSTARPGRCRGHHVHQSPLVSRNELTRGQRRSPLRGCFPGHGPGTIPHSPAPIAPTMLLQIASQDIGQLTDIPTTAPPLPRTTPTTWAPRHRNGRGSPRGVVCRRSRSGR